MPSFQVAGEASTKNLRVLFLISTVGRLRTPPALSLRLHDPAPTATVRKGWSARSPDRTGLGVVRPYLPAFARLARR